MQCYSYIYFNLHKDFNPSFYFEIKVCHVKSPFFILTVISKKQLKMEKMLELTNGDQEEVQEEVHEEMYEEVQEIKNCEEIREFIIQSEDDFDELQKECKVGRRTIPSEKDLISAEFKEYRPTASFDGNDPEEIRVRAFNRLASNSIWYGSYIIDAKYDDGTIGGEVRKGEFGEVFSILIPQSSTYAAGCYFFAGISEIIEKGVSTPLALLYCLSNNKIHVQSICEFLRFCSDYVTGISAITSYLCQILNLNPQLPLG